MLGIVTCVSAVMLSLAIIGVAAKRMTRVPLSLRYLAAASFWVYMVHHPILGLIHTDLKWLLPAASPLMKVVIAFTMASAISLATYELWVRQTALGRWLGFDWDVPRQPSQDSQEASPQDVVSIEQVKDSRPRPVPMPNRRAA
jgi:peptidoglycan/LPS O-acetylase OafA/YrhL